MDKKKKLFILLICILPLMLVTLGFSTWIVIHEISIAPKFDPDSVFYNELNGQTVVYDGTAQLPSSDKIDVNSTFINSKYRKVGQGTSEYKDGIPTNAGEYYIYFNDTRDDATSLGASDVLFTIKKASVKETTNVTVNYNQGTNNGYFTTDMTTSSISYAGTFSHKENNSLTVDGTISYSDTRTKLEIGEYDYSYTFTPSPITDEWGDSVTNYEVYKDDTALIKTKATITFINGSSQYGSIQHIELNGKIANPGNLSKTGYTFDGWKYNDSIWNFDTGVTTDMTLYSGFSIINYTLTYLDKDGSTLTTSNPKTYTIETATFTLTNPTKNGYVFEGWTESNSSNILSTVTISKGSTGNKTFTANWWKPITINMPSDITKDYDKSAVVLSDPSLTINYETVSSLPAGATISYTYSSGSSEMVNYGEYTVTATLTLTEELINQGYKLDTTYSDLVTKVKINKKTIQVDYTWNYSSAFTYDTQTKTVKLKNEPTGLTPIYSNNSYINAGKYTASVSFAEANNDNYVITGTTSTLEWEIKKAQIDCSGVKLSDTLFTYDTQTKTVAVQGIPSNVNSNISGTLSAVNAGNYTVTPGLTVSNSNYELINVPTEFSWEIKKASIDGSSISWVYSETYPFTYDGNEKSVSLNNVPNGVTVTYEGSKGTNAGTYTATATLSCDSNHTVTGAPTSLTWKIDPMNVKLSDEIQEIDYSSSNRYWAVLDPLVENLTSFTNEAENEAVSIDSDLFNVTGITDGLFTYNDSGTHTTYYIAGSTYQAFVSISDTNYKLIGNDYFILKYKTVKTTIGDSEDICTIEDAISLGQGDITLLGETEALEGDTTSYFYVLTAFTSLSLDNGNPYSTYFKENTDYKYELSKRSLYIPHTDDFKSTFADNRYYQQISATTSSTNYVYSTLYIPNNVTLLCSGSSEIINSAAISGHGKVWNRGVIINNGVIDLSSATYHSYGFTKGNGKIYTRSGSIVWDEINLYDWSSAGDAMKFVSLFGHPKSAFPTVAWSVHNISCDLYIYNGAEFNALACFYGNTAGYNEVLMYLVGSSSESTTCLFKPTTTTTSHYVLKKGTDSNGNYITPISSTSINEDGVILSNQLKTQRDKFFLNGNYKDGKFVISMKYLGTTYDFESSEYTPVPYPYMDIEIMSNSVVELVSASYVSLMGTTLKVAKNATLTLDSGIYIAFDRFENGNSMICPYFTNSYCFNKVDAYLDLQGTLNGSGMVGGIVKVGTSGSIATTIGTTIIKNYRYITTRDAGIRIKTANDACDSVTNYKAVITNA